jgi:hypothetical protein
LLLLSTDYRLMPGVLYSGTDSHHPKTTGHTNADTPSSP